MRTYTRLQKYMKSNAGWQSVKLIGSYLQLPVYLSFHSQIGSHGEDRQGYDSCESNTAVITQEASDCGTRTINTDTQGPVSWEEGSNVPDGMSESGTSSQKSMAAEEGRYDPKPSSEMERNGKVVGVNVT